MSTGSELADIVLDIIQDPSYTSDDAIALFNQCAVQMAGRVLFPSLEISDVVTAKVGEVSVSLPDDFQRNLFSCTDELSYGKIEILNSKALMERRGIPDTGTNIKAVVAAKPLLLFAPSPLKDIDLTLGYHRKPDEINADDEVTFLPDGFGDLLVNFACWKLYAKIEQGLEGAKTDTNYYRGLFNEQFEELRISLKEGVSMPAPPISKGERY